MKCKKLDLKCKKLDFKSQKLDFPAFYLSGFKCTCAEKKSLLMDFLNRHDIWLTQPYWISSTILHFLFCDWGCCLCWGIQDFLMIWDSLVLKKTKISRIVKNFTPSVISSTKHYHNIFLSRKNHRTPNDAHKCTIVLNLMGKNLNFRAQSLGAQKRE